MRSKHILDEDLYKILGNIQEQVHKLERLIDIREKQQLQEDKMVIFLKLLNILFFRKILEAQIDLQPPLIGK